MPDSPYRFRFGIFELDLRSHELWRQGTRIRLPKQQFQALSLLVQRAREVVTRDELKNRLWDATVPGAKVFVDEEEGLNKAIEKTRDTLGDSAKNSQFIETLSGLGYRFIKPVEPIIDRPPPRPGPADPGPIGSLAVLPFRDSSPDPGQEYFADGMAEVLTTNLAQIRALRVISRTSTIQYKETRKTMPEIARELNVEGVVEGSVSRSEDHVQVTANLIHAPTDKHLWGNAYHRECELRGVPVLQTQLALAIATEIRIKIEPREKERLANPREVKPEAFDAYARGRFFWNQRNEKGLDTGIEYFNRAIHEEPDYAQAYAGLADCYTMLAWNSMRPPKDALPKAKAAAQRALKLDDQLAEAHSSLAVTLMFQDWDWVGAERHFQRSIELNPNYSVARPWYAFELSALGRHMDACTECQRALRNDPISLPIGVSSGLVFYLARQYDLSLEVCRKILEMDPTSFYQGHFMVGMAYERKGMFNESLRALETAVSLSDRNPHMLAALGHTLARAGQTAGAYKVIDELKERSARGYISPFNIAMVYAGLGQKEETLEWLEKACDDRSMWVIFVNAYPIFDDLRADDKFQALVRRMNFTV